MRGTHVTVGSRLIGAHVIDGVAPAGLADADQALVRGGGAGRGGGHGHDLGHGHGRRRHSDVPRVVAVN